MKPKKLSKPREKRGTYVYLITDLTCCEAHVFSSCRKMYNYVVTSGYNIASFPIFKTIVKNSRGYDVVSENETQYICTRERIL